MTTFEILSLLGMFVSGAVAMWFTARSSRFQYLLNKAAKPCIAKVNAIPPSTIMAVVTNNHTTRITVKSVKVRRKIIGPLYSRPLQTSWKLPSKPANIPIFDATDALMSVAMGDPQYIIETQSNLRIDLNDTLLPGAIYRVSVATTGGKCQSTCRGR